MAGKSKIRLIDKEEGRLVLRDGILAAFFLPKPLHDYSGAVLEVFNQYLDMVPKGVLTWGSIGAGSESWKAVDAKSLDKCRAMLDPAAAKKRPMTAFELVSGKNAADAPEYAFSFIGTKPDKEVPDEVNLMDMTFPTEVVDPSKADTFVENIKGLAAKLPYLSGYVSPSLVYAESNEANALFESRPIALRYPGYDVQDNKSGCMDIGGRSRGARWLTFLGPDLVKKLKGAKAIQNALPKEISTEPAGAGLLIRAGKTPEIGDTNKKEKTPLLRALAKALEPVTVFDEDVLMKSYFADGDADLLKKWERRFLD